MKLLSIPLLALLLLGAHGAGAPIARGDGDALVHRSYPVGALLGADHPATAPILGLGLRGQSFLRPQPGMSEEEDEEPPLRSFAEDEILDLLRAVVPGLGDVEGEQLELDGERLLVTTTPARQERIGEALEAFWAEGATRVEVVLERLRIPPEKVGQLEPSFLAQLRGGEVPAADRASWHDALAAVSARVEVATTLVRPGARTVMGQLRRERYLRDYDVEIAQDSIVGDPGVDTLTTGWAFEVRPFVLQDGSVLLETFGQTAETRSPIRKLSLETAPFGAIDLPVVHVLRATTRSRVSPASARVILLSEDPEAGIQAFLAAARVHGAPTTHASSMRLDASALITPRAERALFAHPASPGYWTREPWPVEERVPALDADRLVETVRARTPPGLWEQDGAWLGLHEGGRLVAMGAGDARSRVRALLEEMEGALLLSLRATVVLVEARPDASKRRLATLTMDVPAGGRVVWQAGTEAAFLSDWGVEVAQEARVGDPIVETLFAGVELEFRATPSPIGEKALFRLDVRMSDVDMPFDLTRPGNDCTGPIEVPRTYARGAVQDLVIDIGGSVVVPLGRLHDGRELSVECALAR